MVEGRLSLVSKDQGQAQSSQPFGSQCFVKLPNHKVFRVEAASRQSTLPERTTILRSTA
jgi:hypothetical protein